MERVLGFLCCLMISNLTLADINKANQAIIDEDYQQAEVELIESAKIGNPEAQHKLAILYYQGLAGKVDKFSAIGWFF
ncbi:hypothetical protein RS130_06755 [Paraglaciecola aquimarina]|uniref:Sel1 repeat family protein n=1 Tax=Paraglaciecola aquimarina TaxID=1235557 RepID=A0ABU3SUI3_9ALTE|nr:hypothetical protein [Paraglaciecola aquimarina]MDU0353671.1 hypothetical protein [Paraglaciecola aquimarina]